MMADFPVLLAVFDGQELMRLTWGMLPALLIFGIPVLCAIGGLTSGITKQVCDHQRRKQLAEIEGSLKMEMLERGFSASEIKEVLEAGMALPGTTGEADSKVKSKICSMAAARR